jgi:hypothetical protein
VFTCDSKDGASQVQLDVARTAVKRLKTLKHPSVLTYLGSCETDKAVLLATEPVQPLSLFLDQASVYLLNTSANLFLNIFVFSRRYRNCSGSMRSCKPKMTVLHSRLFQFPNLKCRRSVDTGMCKESQYRYAFNYLLRYCASI